MNFTKITIHRYKTGPDHLTVTTDLPSGFPMGRELLVLEFRTARWKGEPYCKEHFPGVEIASSTTLDAPYAFRDTYVKRSTPVTGQTVYLPQVRSLSEELALV